MRITRDLYVGDLALTIEIVTRNVDTHSQLSDRPEVIEDLTASVQAAGHAALQALTTPKPRGHEGAVEP